MDFFLGMLTGAVLLFFFLAAVGEVEYETTYTVITLDDKNCESQENNDVTI